MAEIPLVSLFQHSATRTEQTGVNGATAFTPSDSAALRQEDGAETYC
jgi:hypothetical protein